MVLSKEKAAPKGGLAEWWEVGLQYEFVGIFSALRTPKSQESQGVTPAYGPT